MLPYIDIQVPLFRERHTHTESLRFSIKQKQQSQNHFRGITFHLKKKIKPWILWKNHSQDTSGASWDLFQWIRHKCAFIPHLDAQGGPSPGHRHDHLLVLSLCHNFVCLQFPWSFPWDQASLGGRGSPRPCVQIWALLSSSCSERLPLYFISTFLGWWS